MKRSRSSVTDIVLLKSSSSELSVVSLPQTASELNKTKKKGFASQESVASVEAPPSKAENKENRPPRSTRSRVVKSRSPIPEKAAKSRESSPERDSHSSLDLNHIDDAKLYKLAKPRGTIPSILVSEWDDHHLRSDSQLSFPRTSTKTEVGEKSKPKPTATRKARSTEKREPFPTLEPSEATVVLSSERGRNSSASKSPSSSLSRSELDSFNLLESDCEAFSDQEEETPHLAAQNAFSSRSIDALLARLAEPEHVLAVKYKSRCLDNDAFFDLLMSVQALDSCISKMYSVSRDEVQKGSVFELQEQLFGQSKRINLSRLLKSIMMDRKQCFKDEDTASYFINLVRYLLELFIYYENGLLGYRVFDMKLAEIYESSKTSLIGVLDILFKLSQVSHRDESARETYKKLSLKELNKQMNDKRRLQPLSLRKIEVAYELTNPDSCRDEAENSNPKKELAEQMDSAEDLTELDSRAKIQVIHELVEIVMFDGVSYRSYVNDVQAEKSKNPNESIRQMFTNIVRPKPAFSIASSDTHFNMWTFESLMPNMLLVEERRLEADSPTPKSSWFQISDVDAFIKSLETQLRGKERDAVIKSLRKLPASTFRGVNAKGDFLSNLDSFYESQIEAEPEIPDSRPKKSTKNKQSAAETQEPLSASFFPIHSKLSDTVKDNLTLLYNRILESHLNEYRVKHAIQSRHDDPNMPKYEVEVGEGFATLALDWQPLCNIYKMIRPKPPNCDFTPKQKVDVLKCLVQICNDLLNSISKENLSARFAETDGLFGVFNEYILTNCKTLRALDLFAVILDYNIKWNRSLADEDCVICQKWVKRSHDNLDKTTKLKCCYCNQCFHFGCVSFEKRDKGIYFFVYQRGMAICSSCINEDDKKEEERRRKATELQSVEVNDYTLRSNRSREYIKQLSFLDDQPRTRRNANLKRSNSSLASLNTFLLKKRSKKEEPVVEETVSGEDSDDDSDADIIRTKRANRHNLKSPSYP